MLLPLVVLALLVGWAYSQMENTIALTVPSAIDTSSVAIFSYAWVGSPGHELNNITMELITGDTGGVVVDVIAVEYTQRNGNSITYPLHASTPAGQYHIRMNGTIYNGSTPLSTITTRSRTFNITLGNAFQCETPAFIPVRNILDPAYSPLRVATPAGGTIFLLDSLGSRLANISSMLYVVDASFNTTSTNAELELVNIATGGSTVAQQIPQADIVARRVSYLTENITFAPGMWKLRMNFTDPRGPDTNLKSLSTVSDEFYIITDFPCVGLSSANSTSALPSASSTGTSISSSTTSGSQSSASSSCRLSPGLMGRVFFLVAMMMLALWVLEIVNVRG
ncbi:hypothetical protein DFH06DRAFT_1199873 [Mycena polygramma]|nr:hypothetical protein DFH06DRAFT_1199873 [Mycena polygramma]